MTERVHFHPDLIFSVGTQVVTLVDIPSAAGLILHPRGTVGVVVKSPTDHEHSYTPHIGTFVSGAIWSHEDESRSAA